ncbi:hypothetical protein ABZ540_35810 [Nocardia xishanensis]|uniref:hypothetical protein n=1 Tax=Nocardia xishanensis TaxID=238964 RepID=UPI0034108D6F
MSADTSGFDPDPDPVAALPAYQADSTPASGSALWPTIVELLVLVLALGAAVLVVGQYNATATTLGAIAGFVATILAAWRFRRK